MKIIQFIYGNSRREKVREALRNRKFLDLKFRKQHDIEGFIVNFYCHKLCLAIEIDRKVHVRQKDYESLRQALLEEKGINFIRVTCEEVNRDIGVLLENIKGAEGSPLPWPKD